MMYVLDTNVVSELRKVRLGSNDGSVGHAARYYLDRMKSRLRQVHH